MSLRGVVVLPSISMGLPRKVPMEEELLTPKVFLISFINLLGVFGLKTT